MIDEFDEFFFKSLEHIHHLSKVYASGVTATASTDQQEATTEQTLLMKFGFKVINLFESTPKVDAEDFTEK